MSERRFVVTIDEELGNKIGQYNVREAIINQIGRQAKRIAVVEVKQ